MQNTKSKPSRKKILRIQEKYKLNKEIREHVISAYIIGKEFVLRADDKNYPKKQKNQEYLRILAQCTGEVRKDIESAFRFGRRFAEWVNTSSLCG